MISLDKKYTTRDGREACVLALDFGGTWPVVGGYRDNGKDWCLCRWRADGLSDHGEHYLDLIEVKPKITRTYWLAHARLGGVSMMVDSPLQAKIYSEHHSNYWVAITGPHTVEFQEGDGL